jgi:putative dehydrogenase
MNTETRVGLIGLGAMGKGMAQSLRRAGHVPHVFDVRSDVPRRPLPATAAPPATRWPNWARPATWSFRWWSTPRRPRPCCSARRRRHRLRGQHEARQRVRDVLHGGPELVVWLEKRLAAWACSTSTRPISGGAAKAASGQMTMMTAASPPPMPKPSRC